MNDKDDLVRSALSLLNSRDKDDLMRAAFLLLSPRNIATDWATLEKPYSALYDDCARLMLDAAFVLELGSIPLLQKGRKRDDERVELS